MIGRAYLWGLAADGEAGVGNVLRDPAQRHRRDARRARAGVDPRADSRRPAHASRFRARTPRQARRSRVTAERRVSELLASLTSPDAQRRATNALARRPGGRHRAARPASAVVHGHRHRGRALRGASRPRCPPRSSRRPSHTAPAASTHGFAGTLSIGRSATELLLVELGRSATETFERIVLVSSHGGNAEPVARATRRLRHEGRAVMSWAPRFAGDAHAGRAETSIMLALDPARVRRSDGVAGNTAPLTELWPRAAFGRRARRERQRGARRSRGRLGGGGAAAARCGDRRPGGAVRRWVADGAAVA